MNSKSVKNKLGKMAVDMIYKRVKSGFGVNAEGLPPAMTTKQKLKPLSKSYIDYRSGKIKFFKAKQGHTYPVEGSFKKPVTGKFGSAKRSNLTLTGQMLEALGFRIQGAKIFIKVNNKLRKDGLTNAKVAELVSEERPFISLTGTEERILIRELNSILNKLVKKHFG